MKRGVKTVFFGPFIGEFGPELYAWEGWVKRLCRSKYIDYYKIACSFPGRYPLYPDVDEFWPLPQKFLKNPISSRGYITDCWIKDLPRPNNKPFDLPEVIPLTNEVIKDFKKKLPKDTEFIIPWELRYDEEDKRFYGVSIPQDPKSDEDFVTYMVPPSKQIFEKLQPTPKGLKLLKTKVDSKELLISIFPRHRLFRRPDKNWSKGKYERLIRELQREFPQFKLAILGEPGGAFFAEEGMPKGCIDLINISPEHRLDVQLAALKQSVVAIGGQSGAIIFSLRAGCRTLSWGEPRTGRSFQDADYRQTELIYYPSQNPPVNLIIKYVRWMLGHNEIPYKSEIKKRVIFLLYRFLPKLKKESKGLASIRKFLFR